MSNFFFLEKLALTSPHCISTRGRCNGLIITSRNAPQSLLQSSLPFSIDQKLQWVSFPRIPLRPFHVLYYAAQNRTNYFTTSSKLSMMTLHEMILQHNPSSTRHTPSPYTNFLKDTILVVQEAVTDLEPFETAAPNGPSPSLGPRASPSPANIPLPNGKPTSPYPERQQSPLAGGPQAGPGASTVSSKDPRAAAQQAAEMKSVVRRKLTGYVGFANLPNQWHRKSVRKGFNFNVMVVGTSSKVLISFIY